METPVTSSGAGNGTTSMIGEGQQILISGAGGDQQLVMSAEDAAQFFQQAGIQWDAGSGQVIIGDVQPQEGTTEGEVRCFIHCTGAIRIPELGGFQYFIALSCISLRFLDCYCA